MKLDELNFKPHISTGVFPSENALDSEARFLLRTMNCLTPDNDVLNPLFVPILNASRDTKDFILRLLASEDREVMNTQLYGRLFHKTKLQFRRGEYLQRYLSTADWVFQTDADAGSLKVGTADCSILLPVYGGDGAVTVVVYENVNTINDTLFPFYTSIQGDKIQIYDYDCGEEVARILKGRYGVYTSERVGRYVIFVKWD